MAYQPAQFSNLVNRLFKVADVFRAVPFIDLALDFALSLKPYPFLTLVDPCRANH